VTDFIRNGEKAFNLADVAIFLGGTIVLVALATSLVQMRLQARALAAQPTSSGG
jgi:lipoprotein signal peptidase